MRCGQQDEAPAFETDRLRNNSRPSNVRRLLNPIVAGGAMAFSSVSVMTNSLRLRSKAKRITERSGNTYVATAPGRFWAANGGPALAMAVAALVLVVPLVVFTGIDRGWFGS